MTFENFVVGDGNNFAYSAALAVANDISSQIYNPLFIYANPGLGKTHLVKAIGNKVLKRNEYLKVFYTTSRQLIQDYTTAVNNNLFDEFYKFYDEKDLLIFDDVNEDGFFYIYDRLSPECQIVMTSRKSPGQMPHLEHRARKMLNWGLIADMHPLDRISRETILLRTGTRLRAHVPMDIIYLIATRITDNIAKLEEALQRVIAVASISNGRIDKRTVLKVLKNLGY
ncbi:MAG: DnaA/Hda family protein [Candidatus Hydrogenedentota bacterium]